MEAIKKLGAQAIMPYLALAGVAMQHSPKAGLGLLATGLAVLVVSLAVDVSASFAADISSLSSSGPFDKIKTKSESFVTSMIDIAVPVCALAICVACYMMFTGKMPKTFGMCIIGASILIGSSVSIAQYLIK